MQFEVRTNVPQMIDWLTDVQKNQVPFALVLASTMTAKDIKSGEIDVMNKVFDRPTPYALNALQVKPATKADPIASVEFKGFGGTPARRFLNPEVHGGARSQKSSEKLLAGLRGSTGYAVPARGEALNKYGNMTAARMKRIISQLKVSSDGFQNATGSKRSKGSRSKSAFFIPAKGGMIMERKGKTVVPALIFVKAPSYSKRFPFYETGQKVLADKISSNFHIALEKALASARPKR
jgi:hypothetical protein